MRHEFPRKIRPSDCTGHYGVAGIPELPMVRFDVNQIMEDLLSTEFKDVTVRPIWQFSYEDSLAFIQPDYPKSPLIVLHSLLNNPGTPYEVIRYVFAHELLHLRIRPREVKGKMKSHPPEFVEVEHRIIPDYSDCWGWIILNFYPALKFERKKEKVTVKAREGLKYLSAKLATMERAKELNKPVPGDAFGGI